jgi:hypothetical protein
LRHVRIHPRIVNIDLHPVRLELSDDIHN